LRFPISLQPVPSEILLAEKDRILENLEVVRLPPPLASDTCRTAVESLRNSYNLESAARSADATFNFETLSLFGRKFSAGEFDKTLERWEDEIRAELERTGESNPNMYRGAPAEVEEAAPPPAPAPPAPPSNRRAYAFGDQNYHGVYGNPRLEFSLCRSAEEVAALDRTFKAFLKETGFWEPPTVARAPPGKGKKALAKAKQQALEEQLQTQKAVREQKAKEEAELKAKEEAAKAEAALEEARRAEAAAKELKAKAEAAAREAQAKQRQAEALSKSKGVSEESQTERLRNDRVDYSERRGFYADAKSERAKSSDAQIWAKNKKISMLMAGTAPAAQPARATVKEVKPQSRQGAVQSTPTVRFQRNPEEYRNIQRDAAVDTRAARHRTPSPPPPAQKKTGGTPVTTQPKKAWSPPPSAPKNQPPAATTPQKKPAFSLSPTKTAAPSAKATVTVTAVPSSSSGQKAGFKKPQLRPITMEIDSFFSRPDDPKKKARNKSKQKV